MFCGRQFQGRPLLRLCLSYNLRRSDHRAHRRAATSGWAVSSVSNKIDLEGVEAPKSLRDHPTNPLLGRVVLLQLPQHNVLLCQMMAQETK
jgi:hypothetical protein